MTQPVVRRLREFPELPTYAPEYAVNVWELARCGYSPDLDAEVKALAMLDHPHFYAQWYQPTAPENAALNERRHLLLHQVGEMQLIQNTPPEAAAALAHLMSLGLSRHRALHMMLEGVGEPVWSALNENQPSDREAYVRHLRRLTGVSAPSVEPVCTAAGQ